MDHYPARFTNLGDLRRDGDRARVQANGFGPELADFTIRHPWADTREQAEREIRHPATAFETFKIFHELTGLSHRECPGQSTPAPDAMMRHPENRILGNPGTMEREFEESGE